MNEFCHATPNTIIDNATIEFLCKEEFKLIWIQVRAAIQQETNGIFCRAQFTQIWDFREKSEFEEVPILDRKWNPRLQSLAPRRAPPPGFCPGANLARKRTRRATKSTAWASCAASENWRLPKNHRLLQGLVGRYKFPQSYSILVVGKTDCLPLNLNMLYYSMYIFSIPSVLLLQNVVQ